MAASSSTSLLLMTILLVATIASFTAEASVCSQVNVVSGECMPYVMDKASSVTPACCSAVKGLVPLLNTATNKEQACKCLTTISSNMPGVDFSRVKNVPSKCGIKDFPWPLDPDSSVMAGSSVEIIHVLLISILLFATIASFTAEASVCSQVDVMSGECMPYVMDKASSVTPACCSAVKGLAGLLNTSANKEQACKCIKAISSNMPGLDINKVKAVPSKCGIHDFPLSSCSFTAEASVCSHVDLASRECMPDVMDKASSVTSSCCSAMDGLASLLNTAAKEEQACKCLKAIASITIE